MLRARGIFVYSLSRSDKAFGNHAAINVDEQVPILYKQDVIENKIWVSNKKELSMVQNMEAPKK